MGVTKSLEPLVRDGVPHELAVHQGVYIDPYLWEFTDGGKRPDGTRKLLIRSDGDPDWHKWHQAEYAGTTTNRDSENYNAGMYDTGRREVGDPFLLTGPFSSHDQEIP